MAKLEFVHPETKNFPSFSETVEVHTWGLGGTFQQKFYIGSGMNFRATDNVWIEVIYAFEGSPIFYTRNFLHLAFFSKEHDNTAELENQLDEVLQKGEGKFNLGDMLPETCVTLNNDSASLRSVKKTKRRRKNS